MLRSPPLARSWTPRIKRYVYSYSYCDYFKLLHFSIVLDQIHSIGQQEGGAVWEQNLLFAPSSIMYADFSSLIARALNIPYYHSGLSVTIGAPKQFSDYLSDVQKAYGFGYDFIQHEHRHSHLRKNFHIIDGHATFKSLEDHCPSIRTRFLHPISPLSFGARTLPSDLSLEARDTLTLFGALYKAKDRINCNLESLKRTTFFADIPALLRQKEVLRYESRLKSVLQDLLKVSDPRDLTTPLGEVIDSLQDPRLVKWAENSKKPVTRVAFRHDLLGLLADLHSKNYLVGLFLYLSRVISYACV